MTKKDWASVLLHLTGGAMVMSVICAVICIRASFMTQAVGWCVSAGVFSALSLIGLLLHDRMSEAADFEEYGLLEEDKAP